MAIIQDGNGTTNQQRVDANKAALVTVRSPDYGTGGVYSLSAVSGVMAAGLAAGAPIFSFRWTSATLIALIRSIRIGAGGITAFAAGVCNFDVMMARSFTASDSGGSTITPTGNTSKRRTSMATSAVGDVRISSTAALSAGTRTLDAFALANAFGSTPVTAGSPLVAPTKLLSDDRDANYPLVLAQNEGFIIRGTVPATGTWGFGVSVEWEEVASY